MYGRKRFVIPYLISTSNWISLKWKTWWNNEDTINLKNAAHLPGNLEELEQICGKDSVVEILKKVRNKSLLSPTQAAAWKYTGGALQLGRPLNTVMIFMGGATGSGKSTTINNLFEDKLLCSTSTSTSETSKPVKLYKNLVVTEESPPIVGKLMFVDVPGMFDTDTKKEAENLAAILNFRQNSEELAYISLFQEAKSDIPNLPPDVYPNIILFVVRASDNRIKGPDSFFRKSLETLKVQNLFDKQHPNLIIVLSHAKHLGGRTNNKFSTMLKEKTRDMREITQEVLGITDVDVIPIENDGDGQDLEKRGDFYVLPNNELSHHNLFKAMEKNFTRNNDLMGRLFVSWYFGTNCPEKKEKVIVDDFKMEKKRANVTTAARILQALNVAVSKEAIGPQYNFQSLGYGYCPVTEDVKPANLLSESGDTVSKNLNLIQIEDSQFLVPECITVSTKRMNIFRLASFYEKEQYQEHMKSSYGIQGGIKLAVSASAEGRWISDKDGSSSSSLIKMVQETQVATFRLDNPERNVVHTGFLKELHSLPSKYTRETAKEFRRFFSRWGTHLIYEEAVGGAIRLFFTVHQRSKSEQQFREIKAKMSKVFSCISSAKGQAEYQDQIKNLQGSGLSNEQLEIEGGVDPPTITTLESLNPSRIQKWVQTIPEKPVELRHSIKLFPYYDFIKNSEQHESLREATLEYLDNSINSKIGDPTNRQEISKQGVERAIEAPARKCFPKGTLVELWDGRRKPIEQLSPEDSQVKTMRVQASLFKTKSETDKITKTSFCKFFDEEPSELCDYLVFHFSNGKKLIVSDIHMIFHYHPDGQVKGKQAKNFKVGDMAVYFGPTGENMETPVIEEITREKHVGAYAPLMTSGTFIADGFLVSSYAHTDSFFLAQIALFPIKLWYMMKHRQKNKSLEEKINIGYNEEIL